MSGVADDKNSGAFSDAEYLLDAMNFGAIREWMHLTDILNDPLSPKADAVQKYTDALNMYARLGIEITGMSHTWFIVDKDGTTKPVNGKMYRRDTS